jgi:hypothetical protein
LPARRGTAWKGNGTAGHRLSFGYKTHGYCTLDSLEAVGGHLAKCAGSDKEFKPGNAFARTSRATARVVMSTVNEDVIRFASVKI